MAKKVTFVEQISTMRPEKHSPGATVNKRFSWSAPIVSPQEGKNHAFSSVTKPAPKPKASGTLAPASETLAADRRMVAQARKAKKARY